MKTQLLATAILLTWATTSMISQEPRDQSQGEPSASIAGKVTLRGAPVGAAQISVEADPRIGPGPPARAVTGPDGRYRIANLSPGRYRILVAAPPLVPEESLARGYGREIGLERGETRDNVDFSMIVGGVITGRVSDAGGRPLIEHQITVMAVSEDRFQRPYYYGGYDMMRTDDRGIYRVYGVPPGRYKVSVGEGGASAARRLDYNSGYYPVTYHPGVVDESKARLIEVTEGGEASGVDIVVGPFLRTYQASGRIVDAESGRPQAGINWGYGGNAMSTFEKQSDEHGGFKITGLMPGRYTVFAGCEGNYYSDGVEFDVTDHDVTGLEIRRHRGASISGKVVVEGLSDPALLSKVTQVSLGASSGSNSVGSRVDPDGSFYFCGLRPGRFTISASSWRQAGFWLQRVDRNGVDLRDGVEVAPGDNVSDVRVVLTYGSGVIRGQVTVVGYELPSEVRLSVVARRAGDKSPSGRLSTDTDDRGRFVFEGLAAGEYEIAYEGGMRVWGDRLRDLPTLLRAKQTVIVADGAETAVTLIVQATKR